MITNAQQHNTTAALTAYLFELSAGDPIPKPENESQREMLDRIMAASGPCEIDQETDFWYLEILPPRFMRDNYFCFAEGVEPFRLFWSRGARYFVRSLDWQQTENLCRLAGIRASD